MAPQNDKQKRALWAPSIVELMVPELSVQQIGALERFRDLEIMRFAQSGHRVIGRSGHRAIGQSSAVETV
jgi:hypothetical protein